MLTETGRVVAVAEDSLWVETIRKSTCGACAARKGCGHGLLNQYGSGRAGLVRVLPGATLKPADCEVNDQVMISLPEEVILRGSLVVYLLPLVGMLLGALVPSLIDRAGDAAALAGAGIGFIIGLGLVRWHAVLHRDDQRLQPTLKEIVEGGRVNNHPVKVI